MTNKELKESKEKLLKQLEDITNQELKIEKDKKELEKVRKITEEKFRVSSGVHEIFAQGIINENVYWMNSHTPIEIEREGYLTVGEILGDPIFRKEEKVILVADGNPKTGIIDSYVWCHKEYGIYGDTIADVDTKFVKNVKWLRERN